MSIADYGPGLAQGPRFTQLRKPTLENWVLISSFSLVVQMTIFQRSTHSIHAIEHSWPHGSMKQWFRRRRNIFG